MRIRGLEVFRVFAGWRNFVLVKLLTDEGIVGWGDATLEGRDATLAAAVQELEPALVGEDPFDIEYLVRALYLLNLDLPEQVGMTAISGVEQALWDIVGKKLGQPVYRLMGGKVRHRIRCYANGWYFECRDRKDLVERAKEVVARGFTALKWDPFLDAYEWLEAAEEDEVVDRVRQVRDAVGEGVDLMLEFHGRLAPSAAVRVAQRLAPYRPYWIEEPCPPGNLDSLCEVRAKIGLPVAAGERLFGRRGFREALRRRAFDVAQPDVSHVGGLLEAKKVAAMCEAEDIPIAPHMCKSQVCLAATVQLLANIPNGLILETFLEPAWLEELVDQPYRVQQGYLEVRDRPGLGIEVREEVLGRYPPRTRHIVPSFWLKDEAQRLESPGAGHRIAASWSGEIAREVRHQRDEGEEKP